MEDIIELPTVVGTPFAGGFFAGHIFINHELHALILAPKAEGEKDGIAWSGSRKTVPGALSYVDGMANTVAMAEAGSDLAQWARGLSIGGQTDWYIPAQDELEILYRNLKPTTDENTLYGRSGINAAAAPATHPYTRALPAQTACAAFQAGGEQAFEPDWYWSSTQHAVNSGGAWLQYFYYGGQTSTNKSFEGRARAVRRLKI